MNCIVEKCVHCIKVKNEKYICSNDLLEVNSETICEVELGEEC